MSGQRPVVRDTGDGQPSQEHQRNSDYTREMLRSSAQPSEVTYACGSGCGRSCQWVQGNNRCCTRRNECGQQGCGEQVAKGRKFKGGDDDDTPPDGGDDDNPTPDFEDPKKAQEFIDKTKITQVHEMGDYSPNTLDPISKGKVTAYLVVDSKGQFQDQTAKSKEYLEGRKDDVSLMIVDVSKLDPNSNDPFVKWALATSERNKGKPTTVVAGWKQNENYLNGTDKTHPVVSSNDLTMSLKFNEDGEPTAASKAALDRLVQRQHGLELQMKSKPADKTDTTDKQTDKPDTRPPAERAKLTPKELHDAAASIEKGVQLEPDTSRLSPTDRKAYIDARTQQYYGYITACDLKARGAAAMTTPTDATRAYSNLVNNDWKDAGLDSNLTTPANAIALLGQAQWKWAVDSYAAGDFDSSSQFAMNSMRTFANSLRANPEDAQLRNGLNNTIARYEPGIAQALLNIKDFNTLFQEDPQTHEQPNMYTFIDQNTTNLRENLANAKLQQQQRLEQQQRQGLQVPGQAPSDLSYNLNGNPNQIQSGPVDQPLGPNQITLGNRPKIRLNPQDLIPTNTNTPTDNSTATDNSTVAVVKKPPAVQIPFRPRRPL